VIVLGDFGEAFVPSLENEKVGIVGSLFYMAPELLQAKHGFAYNFAVDIYALACSVASAYRTGAVPRY